MSPVRAFLIVATIASSSCHADSSSSFSPTSIHAPFVEQFTRDWSTRWSPSEATKDAPEGAKPDEIDLYRYRGEWSVEAASDGVALSGDEGLVVKTAAAHHAISAAFPEIVDPKDKGIVVQYDLKLQEGLECGGAYIKLLTESKKGIQNKEFDDKTPYTIMFGPDRCGNTNKVHFIFRHKNPKTGEYEEKHLKNPPSPKSDKLTNLYTLVVKPDNSFKIFINNEEVTKGSLLEDFDPAVNPPKEIDDPKDKKPADWVDAAKIPDPDATKPDDWDEDAPRMIEDASAKMPEDWLVDAPAYIADPKAEKPEDWDDEEDGEWTAPQIPNPECEKVSGCGEWKRPQIMNPAYKGKWSAPMIDNPAYKGEWKPRQIPNPNYFEDKHPANFNRIMGVGIELWTMQAGLMFDNLYVGYSESDARQLAEETWAKKKEIESASAEKEEAATEKENEDATAEGSSESGKDDSQYMRIWKIIQQDVRAFITKAQKDPVAAVKRYPSVVILLVTALLAPFLIVSLFSGGSKKVDEGKKKEKVSPKKSEKKEDEASATGNESDDGKLRKRK